MEARTWHAGYSVGRLFFVQPRGPMGSHSHVSGFLDATDDRRENPAISQKGKRNYGQITSQWPITPSIRVHNCPFFSPVVNSRIYGDWVLPVFVSFRLPHPPFCHYPNLPFLPTRLTQQSENQYPHAQRKTVV